MVSMMKSYILGAHWKIRLLGGEGGGTKKQYRGEDCLKRGGLEQFTILRGRGGARQEGGVAHYVIYNIYIYIYIVCDHKITQAMQFAETSF